MMPMNDIKITEICVNITTPTSLLLVPNNSSDKILNIDMARVCLQRYMINMYINIYTPQSHIVPKNNHMTMVMNEIEQKQV